MTVKKRKLHSQKVSNSKHEIVKKGTSLRSVRTNGARTGKHRSRSNSKLNSNISEKKKIQPVPNKILYHKRVLIYLVKKRKKRKLMRQICFLIECSND